MKKHPRKKKRTKRTKRTKWKKRTKQMRKKKQTSKRKNPRKKNQNTKGIKYRQSGGNIGDEYGAKGASIIRNLSLYDNDENMFIPYYLGMGGEGIVMLYLRNLSSLPEGQRERLKEYAEHWERFYKGGDRKVPYEAIYVYYDRVKGGLKEKTHSSGTIKPDNPILLRLNEDAKTFIDEVIPPEKKGVVKIIMNELDPFHATVDEIRIMNVIKDDNNYEKYKDFFAQLTEDVIGKDERYFCTNYVGVRNLAEFCEQMISHTTTEYLKSHATEEEQRDKALMGEIKAKQILDNFKDTKEIMKQLATGLAYLHSIGIVHSDLKPENVMVDKDKSSGIKVTIIDFGLSVYQMKGGGRYWKQALPHEQAYCCLQLPGGSPAYSSPEKIKWEQIMSPDSEKTFGFGDDWWAFAVIFHECVHASCGYNPTPSGQDQEFENTFMQYDKEKINPYNSYPNEGNYEFEYFKKQPESPESDEFYHCRSLTGSDPHRPSSFLFFGNRDQELMKKVKKFGEERKKYNLPPVAEWPDNLLNWAVEKSFGILRTATPAITSPSDRAEIREELVKCSDFYRNFFVADPEKRPFISLKDEVEKFGEKLTAADNLYDSGEKIDFF